MQLPNGSDAEQQYLSRVVADCAEILGPGIELEGLELEAGDVVVLRLRYRLGTTTWTSDAAGETVIAAHAALRERLVLDRVRLGFNALVGEPG